MAALLLLSPSPVCPPPPPLPLPQVLGVMDSLWKAAGLDLCLSPYPCVATGDQVRAREGRGP